MKASKPALLLLPNPGMPPYLSWGPLAILSRNADSVLVQGLRTTVKNENSFRLARSWSESGRTQRQQHERNGGGADRQAGGASDAVGVVEEAARDGAGAAGEGADGVVRSECPTARLGSARRNFARGESGTSERG